MFGDEDTITAVLNRLRRTQGQLARVIAIIEQGPDRKEMITQLAAVSRTLDRAGFMIVASGLLDCINESSSGEPPRPTETQLESFFALSRSRPQSVMRTDSQESRPAVGRCAATDLPVAASGRRTDKENCHARPGVDGARHVRDAQAAGMDDRADREPRSRDCSARNADRADRAI
ncbi:MAG: hypothetical protein CK429_33115 [Mycobacterium sp.]|nr:metal-sensing transcriptional repressor [Mycobacterium sp.]PJE03458.1 MAG: hypothetical protein CK429_33115 [Mycobacterium sp.]TDK88399.1 hypothetical protein EI067_27255 [Mycobacterium paragordonae]TDK99862.1 hypothetical protein EUA05_30400 [Mycobacterium paragordonae]